MRRNEEVKKTPRVCFQNSGRLQLKSLAFATKTPGISGANARSFENKHEGFNVCLHKKTPIRFR